jgi:prolipoprotein diacylglyceryltransferase
VERYLIEKIRVNPDIEMLGIKATQAEYISVLLVLIGVIGIIWTVRRHQPSPQSGT